jgi:hypothetical protein
MQQFPAGQPEKEHIVSHSTWRYWIPRVCLAVLPMSGWYPLGAVVGFWPWPTNFVLNALLIAVSVIAVVSLVIFLACCCSGA